MAQQSSAAHGLLFSGFWICRHSVGLRRRLDQSQGLYLHRPTQTQKGLCTRNCICYRGRLQTFPFIRTSLSVPFISVILAAGGISAYQCSFRNVCTVCVCVCCVHACVSSCSRRPVVTNNATNWTGSNSFGICARNKASGNVLQPELAKQKGFFLPWSQDVAASITGRDIGYSELWTSLASPGKQYLN